VVAQGGESQRGKKGAGGNSNTTGEEEKITVTSRREKKGTRHLDGRGSTNPKGLRKDLYDSAKEKGEGEASKVEGPLEGERGGYA